MLATLTVQTDKLLDVYVIPSPEVAVAVNAGAVPLSAVGLRALNVIVCGVGLTVNVWVTGAAAA